MQTIHRISLVLTCALVAGVASAQEGGRRAEPGGPRPMSPVITALDTDQDGVIGPEELNNAVAALKKLDGNSDGKLTGEELRPAGFPGSGPRGGGFGGPPGGRGGLGGGAAGVFESDPLANDDLEKKILPVLDEMSGRSRGMMSVPRDDGRFLRMLVESLEAKNVVEIGTSHGYSGTWIGLALLKTGGKMTTFEIDATRANLARGNFKKAGVDKVIKLVEGDAHQEVTKLKDPIDLLFVDADKEGYIDYLEKLLPIVRPGGLVVAHNINAAQADPRYIKAITTNPKLETLFLNVGASGIAVTMKKR